MTFQPSPLSGYPPFWICNSCYYTEDLDYDRLSKNDEAGIPGESGGIQKPAPTSQRRPKATHRDGHRGAKQAPVRSPRYSGNQRSRAKALRALRGK